MIQNVTMRMNFLYTSASMKAMVTTPVRFLSWSDSPQKLSGVQLRSGNTLSYVDLSEPKPKPEMIKETQTGSEE